MTDEATPATAQSANEALANPALSTLEQDWRPALLAYVGRGQESALARAHDLGRDALAARITLIDVLAVHHRVTATLLRDTMRTTAAASTSAAPAAEELSELLDRCADFLRESVTPYVMAQQAYRGVGSGASKSQARPAACT